MKILSINEIQSMLLDLMKKVHTFLEENGIAYYMLGGSTLGAIRHGGFIPWDDDIDIGMLRDDYEKFLKVCHNFDSEYAIVNFKNAKNCDFALTRIYINNTMIDDKSVAKTKLDKRLYFDIFPLDIVPESEEERRAFEKKIIKKKKSLGYMYARNYENSSAEMFIKNMIAAFYAPFRGHILKSCDKLMTKYQNIDSSYVCSLCSQYSFKKQVMPKVYYGTPVLHKFEDSEFYIPEQTHKYLSTLFGEDYMEIPPEDKRRKGHDIYLLDKE